MSSTYQASIASGSRHLSRLPARLPLYIHSTRWSPPPALPAAQFKQELQAFKHLALLQAIGLVAKQQGRSTTQQLHTWGLS